MEESVNVIVCSTDNFWMRPNKRSHSSSARLPTHRTSRIVGVVAGMVALTIGIHATWQGLPPSRYLPNVFPGLAFAAISWVFPPLSRPYNYSAIGLAGVIAWASPTPTAFVLYAVIVVMAIWGLFPERRISIDIDPARIAIAESPADQSDASGHTADLRALGFTEVGALNVPTSEDDVSLSVLLLLSPDGYSYASVIDTVFSIASAFAVGRQLESRNSAIAPTPPTVIANDVPGGAVADVVTAHDEALVLLTRAGQKPILLNASEIPQIAVQSERESVEWVKRTRPRIGAHRVGLLADHPDRNSAISTWIGDNPSMSRAD